MNSYTSYFIVIMFIMMPLFSYARTVHNYVMKKPGEAAPIGKTNQLQNFNEPYVLDIDEDVLAKEQFYRVKMQELQGREMYQENRKTTVTRTY